MAALTTQAVTLECGGGASAGELTPALLAAFDALRPREALLVRGDAAVAGLLAALARERPGAFEWSPLVEGPDRWEVEVERRAQPRGTHRRITEALAWDHDRLERLEQEAFDARTLKEYAEAGDRFARFAHGLRRHIRFEETILFARIQAMDPRA